MVDVGFKAQRLANDVLKLAPGKQTARRRPRWARRR
jgi:hypothetical protein